MKKRVLISLFTVLFAVILISVSAFSIFAGETAKKGDVNGDGMVDVCDCVIIAKYVNGKCNLTAEEYYKANVNGDGIVDINDAKYIAENIAKINSQFLESDNTPIIDL